MEIWKPCGKYSNYEVSNKGRVRNSITGHILRQSILRQGYAIVTLYSDKTPHNELVHRLVAESFLEGDPNLDVRHKNGKRLDNYPDNLTYSTRQETVQHGYDQGRKPPRQVKVRIVETGDIFDTATECASKLGVSVSNISKCINGAMRTCQGYHFEKVE